MYRLKANTLRSDREVVLEAVRLSSGHALKFADDTLRSDREFVLEVVRLSSWGALQFADDTNARELLRAATAVGRGINFSAPAAGGVGFSAAATATTAAGGFGVPPASAASPEAGGFAFAAIGAFPFAGHAPRNREVVRATSQRNILTQPSFAVHCLHFVLHLVLGVLLWVSLSFCIFLSLTFCDFANYS